MPFMRISPVKGSNEVQVDTIEVPHLRLNEEQRAAAMREEREKNRRAERYQEFTPVKPKGDHAPMEATDTPPEKKVKKGKGSTAKEGDDGNEREGEGPEGAGEAPSGEADAGSGEDGAPSED